MSRVRGIKSPNMHVRGDKDGLSGAEVDSFLRLWAIGAKATAPSGRTGATHGKADGAVPIDAFVKFGINEEVIDLAGASSVESVNNLLPANAIILPIISHCVTDFSTPTTYGLGVSGSNTKFGSAKANDNVSEGPVYNSAHWAGTVAIFNTTAGKVKVTPNAAGTGKLHVAVPYIQFLGGLERTGY